MTSADIQHPALRKFFGASRVGSTEEAPAQLENAEQDASAPSNTAVSPAGDGRSPSVDASEAVAPLFNDVAYKTSSPSFRQLYCAPLPAITPTVAFKSVPDGAEDSEAISFWLVDAFGALDKKVGRYEETVPSHISHLPTYVRLVRIAFNEKSDTRHKHLHAMIRLLGACKHTWHDDLVNTLQNLDEKTLLATMKDLADLSVHVNALSPSKAMSESTVALCWKVFGWFMATFVKLHKAKTNAK